MPISEIKYSCVFQVHGTAGSQSGRVFQPLVVGGFFKGHAMP